MLFQSQREVMDLALQISSTVDRVMRLQRIFGLNLQMSAERGISPENISRTLVSLELLDRELGLVVGDVGSCQKSIKLVYKSMGYNDTIPEIPEIFRQDKKSD